MQVYADRVVFSSFVELIGNVQESGAEFFVRTAAFFEMNTDAFGNGSSEMVGNRDAGDDGGGFDPAVERFGFQGFEEQEILLFRIVFTETEVFGMIVAFEGHGKGVEPMALLQFGDCPGNAFIKHFKQFFIVHKQDGNTILSEIIKMKQIYKYKSSENRYNCI